MLKFIFKTLAQFIALCSLFPVLCICGEKPDWLFDYNRRVINGNIIHYGVGMGNSPSAAQSLAEGMAIRSIVLECSLAHKNILISDRYIEQFRQGYRAHVRASLFFEDCEKAKQATGVARTNLESFALKEQWENAVKAENSQKPETQPQVQTQTQSEASVEASADTSSTNSETGTPLSKSAEDKQKNRGLFPKIENELHTITKKIFGSGSIFTSD